MKPDSNKNEWKQPEEKPSGAPYVSADDDSNANPTVTMSSDDPVGSEVTEDPDSLTGVDKDQPTASAESSNDEPVRWQASEYINRQKNSSWFVIFGIVVAVLMAIAIFVMQAVTFAILVPVMAAALIVYTRRPPRVLNYTLSNKGLHINDQLYPFADFKGFGVIRDGGEYSVMLLPIKRFHPGVTVYFPEESGEAIVDMLATRLPMQDLHLDAIDKIVRKLRI